MQALLKRLTTSDLKFVRSSALLAVGFAVARALGFGFSLLLGRALSVEDYGYITTSLFIAGLLGIATQPFVQHIWARSISVSRENQTVLDHVISSGVVLQLGLVAATIVVAVPVLLLTHSFDISVFVVFLGVTLFYTFNGLARGFESTWRLVVVFVGSNLLQFIATFVIYFILDSKSPYPALLVYGLSYMIPVVYLLVAHPLPTPFRAANVDRGTILDLIKSTIPVWVSHLAYVISFGVDVVLLSLFWGESYVGAYSMAKTLSLLFDFIPMGISTLLMPRIAAKAGGRRQLVTLSIGAMMSVQFVFAVGFVLLYRPIVTFLFGTEYLVPNETILLMVAAALLWSIHTILASALIGANFAALEGTNRVIILAVLYGAGFLLVPSLATTGVALTDLITSVVAVSSIPLLLRWWRARIRSRNADPDTNANSAASGMN